MYTFYIITKPTLKYTYKYILKMVKMQKIPGDLIS